MDQALINHRKHILFQRVQYETGEKGTHIQKFKDLGEKQLIPKEVEDEIASNILF